MKALITTLILFSLTTLAFAAVDNEIPVTIKIKNRMGTITFPHQEHADRIDCSRCHGDTIAKILPMGIDKGHATCRSCHQEITHDNSCGGCHARDTYNR